ncbi:MAG: hypothetical protein KW793_02165, partial [Candidatus Doudnabacteria bacterium]|nr:hypothetical protein [Candidatus Doudnabacteria bacterium]
FTAGDKTDLRFEKIRVGSIKRAAESFVEADVKKVEKEDTGSDWKKWAIIGAVAAGVALLVAMLAKKKEKIVVMDQQKGTTNNGGSAPSTAPAGWCVPIPGFRVCSGG